MVNLLLGILWPSRCVACNAFVREGRAFCDTCEATVTAVGDACPGCAMPMVAGSACAGCHRHAFPFARALAALVYGGAVTPALMRWKHGESRSVGPAVAAAFRPLLRVAVAGGAEVACPVPLHPARLRQRGFNQALDLLRAARRHDRTSRISISCDAILRTVDTPALGHASPTERRQIVAGAFRVVRPWLITGKHVLLADDVMTSGATFAECTRVILDAGARQVTVAALARAL